MGYGAPERYLLAKNRSADSFDEFVTYREPGDTWTRNDVGGVPATTTITNVSPTNSPGVMKVDYETEGRAGTTTGSVNVRRAS